MPLAIEKRLTPATGHPVEQGPTKSDHRLNIVVVFTSPEATLPALKEAGAMAESLGTRITLLVPQVVPYPLPLEKPPVTAEFNETHFRQIATQTAVETTVQIHLCRDKFQALHAALQPGSLVIVGGRKRRWWPSSDESLARKLRRSGHEVIFKETE